MRIDIWINQQWFLDIIQTIRDKKKKTKKKKMKKVKKKRKKKDVVVDVEVQIR